MTSLIETSPSSSTCATSTETSSATSAIMPVKANPFDRVSFGLYKLKGEICQISLEMISDELIKCGQKPHFDTAQSYFNEKIVGQVVKSLAGNATVTTKLKKFSTHARARMALAHSIYDLGQIDNLLLHNPMNLGNWTLLEELMTTGQVKAIGVSNYGQLELAELLANCQIRPTINQIEIHPFVNLPKLIELIKFCQLNGIKVVGHTVLAQGKFFDHPVLKAVADVNSKSVAQIMIKWALQKGVDICLKTTSRNHLDEIIEAVEDSWNLTAEQELLIDGIHQETQFIFYNKGLNGTNGTNGSESYGSEATEGSEAPVFTVSEVPYLASELLKDFDAMKNKQTISDVCMKMPKSHRANKDLIDALAAILFPNEKSLEANRNRYDSKLKTLRKYYAGQLINLRKEKWQGKTCCLLTHSPSNRITNPEPMPVDVAESVRIDPFIDWLATNQPIRAPQMFTLGTMFPDGRMDMCKQVVGPTHIGKLCDAVAKNHQVKHFLLGNNIACDGGDWLGAEAMAKLMASSAKIETWYLAGNCLNSECIKILCHGLKTNTVCRALWLKRNPVLALGAGYLGDLFNYNRTLELLDLHNCGLLDAGLVAFCQNIQARPEDLSLKHLYLDANGITSDAKTMQIFCEFLAYYKNNLESLFISINKLGDTGCMQICQTLAGSTSLKCLVLSSNGITDLAVESIVDCALKCPNLQVLDLGYYKSTADMGESQNKITDKSLPALIKLLTEHRNLCLLDLIKNQISVAGLEVLAKIDSSATLHMSELKSTPSTSIESPKPKETTSESHSASESKSESKSDSNSTSESKSVDSKFGEFPVYVIRHDKEVLRKIKHTEMVYHIDSVYRNNM